MSNQSPDNNESLPPVEWIKNSQEFDSFIASVEADHSLIRSFGLVYNYNKPSANNEVAKIYELDPGFVKDMTAEQLEKIKSMYELMIGIDRENKLVDRSLLMGMTHCGQIFNHIKLGEDGKLLQLSGHYTGREVKSEYIPLNYIPETRYIIDRSIGRSNFGLDSPELLSRLILCEKLEDQKLYGRDWPDNLMKSIKEQPLEHSANNILLNLAAHHEDLYKIFDNTALAKVNHDAAFKVRRDRAIRTLDFAPKHLFAEHGAAPTSKSKSIRLRFS